jgi:predicted PurR-regulated permease PerM
VNGIERRGSVRRVSDGSPDSQPPTSQDGVELYASTRLGPGLFALLFIASFVALAYTMMSFIHDIILAMVLVTMFRPSYHAVARLLGGNRWAASGVVTFLIIVLVAAPLGFLGVSLVQQARLAYDAIGASLGEGLSGAGPLAWTAKRVQEFLADFGLQLSAAQVHTFMGKTATSIQARAFAAGGSVLSNLASMVVHFAVMMMIVFYLLVDADRLKDFIYGLSPLPREDEELIARRFREVAKGTLVSNGVGSIGQGILCGIAVWIVGLPSPLFWGSVMTILAFLPLAGVSIVAVPMAGYLFVTGSTMEAAVFLAFCVGQAAIFENIVKTKLIGESAAMPDLLAFLAILGGLAVFGVLGLLYGPLIATAFLTLTELYLTSYRRTLALNFVGRRVGGS